MGAINVASPLTIVFGQYYKLTHPTVTPVILLCCAYIRSYVDFTMLYKAFPMYFSYQFNYDFIETVNK